MGLVVFPGGSKPPSVPPSLPAVIASTSTSSGRGGAVRTHTHGGTWSTIEAGADALAGLLRPVNADADADADAGQHRAVFGGLGEQSDGPPSARSVWVAGEQIGVAIRKGHLRGPLLLFAPDLVTAAVLRGAGPRCSAVPPFAQVRQTVEDMLCAEIPLASPRPKAPDTQGVDDARPEGRDGHGSVSGAEHGGSKRSFAGMFGEAELCYLAETCDRSGSSAAEDVCRASEAVTAAIRRDYALAVLHGVSAPLA